MMSSKSHQRKCWDCGNIAEHLDNITPEVLCKICGSQDTRLIKETQSEPQLKKWLRFNYKVEDNESGLFGRVLSYLFVERRAFYAEPWPENEWAIYLKAEGDNLKRMGEIGREAGLRPIAFTEVRLEI